MRHTHRHRPHAALLRKKGASTPGWVWMLGLFAVLIIWQGAFRKWFLPGLETPLYIAKDVALLGAVVLYGMRHGFHLARPLKGTILPALWGGFAFIVFLQAFNWNYPTLIGSVVGVRSYLLYSTLLILLPMAMERIQNPRRFIFWVLLLGFVPVLVLGMYQFQQPIDAWVNQYVSDEQRLVTVAGRPRIVGTFSYIGGMENFLSLSIFLGMGVLLAGMRYRDRAHMWLGGAFLILALVVGPMSGSRSVVFGALVPLPLILYAVLKGYRGLSVAVGVGVVAIAIGYLISEVAWLAQGWETIGQRIESGQRSGEQEQRFLYTILDPISKMSVAGVFGYGAGGTHEAAVALSGQRASIPVGVEGGAGRVILELGVIGGLFYFALKVWLAWTAWVAMIRASNAWETLLGVTVFGTLLLGVPGDFVFNHNAGAMYWLCAGIAVWLWSRQEVRIQSVRHSSRTTHPHG